MKKYTYKGLTNFQFTKGFEYRGKPNGKLFLDLEADDEGEPAKMPKSDFNEEPGDCPLLLIFCIIAAWGLLIAIHLTFFVK